MNGIEWDEQKLTENLLKRLEGSLPQRMSNVDTGEMADDFRLSVSAEERAHLVRLLKR